MRPEGIPSGRIFYAEAWGGLSEKAPLWQILPQNRGSA